MIKLVNKTSYKNVPKDVQEIIPSVIEFYKNEYKNNILEIRLLGSIPRGEFIENVSDVDFLCILKANKSIVKNANIKIKENELTLKLEKYTKVDLDITSIDLIENDFGYKLLIMTDSICIFGDNIIWVKKYKIPGIELAKLWNPNPKYLLRKYNKRLQEIESEYETKNLSKLIGKDFIKAFRPVLMKQQELFSRSILKSKNYLCKFDSENTSLYEKLFHLYINQTASIYELVTILEKVELYININKDKLFE